MLLIVGLGNPGEKYRNTRHNVGFMVVDQLADRLWVRQWQKKFHGLLTKVGDRMLFKPQTFMNNSGQAVGELVNFYQLSTGQIVVIHDDVDLPIGIVKIKQGGGSAGHHGLEAIDQVIGQDYWRFRVGIGHERSSGGATRTEATAGNIISQIASKGARENLATYVLSPFTDNQLPNIDQLTDKVVEFLETLTKNNAQKEKHYQPSRRRKTS